MPDERHDTDPLADTQTSEDSAGSASPPEPGASATLKKRAVRAGDVLDGRYELVEDVGEGGMATVFRAKDRELRREVAVKVLFPHLARREDVVRRFHREARAAAGLEHANILRVYDVGGADGEDPPYIVMELIRGRSLLAELEQRGPILAEIVACLGAVLADALAVAHEAGIIHRDIKPANVMIAPGGRVLLTDFGVARLETEDSLVTKTGALLGTPAYMSPEQATGDTATARSDIYSLGATLYQLATGTLPYTGSPAKVLAALAQGALVPAVRRRAAVGPELSRVLDRMMATEAAARPRSAAEIASELRALVGANGLGEPRDELSEYLADPGAFETAKQPIVVRAVVAAAERAIRDGKLPRAIALADRASALAPEDPAVIALVQAVTEGGKNTRRRRAIALVAGLLAVGGAATTAVSLLDGAGRAASAAVDAVASAEPVEAGSSIAPADASAGVAALDAQAIAMVPDAGLVVRARDAGVAARRPDAAGLALVRDAEPADASVAASLPADAAIAPARGAIVVKNDTWCDVEIDGVARGRLGREPFPVDAGRHTVTCTQPGTGKTWTREVVVVAGQSATAEGAMLETLAVRLEVDASIDGVPYARGTVARLKAGRYEVIAGGARTRVDIRVACTIRVSPELGCY